LHYIPADDILDILINRLPFFYMENSKPQSAGGKAAAIIQKQKAISNYYKNPNYCKQCSSIINVGNQKVSAIKN